MLYESQINLFDTFEKFKISGKYDFTGKKKIFVEIDTTYEKNEFKKLSAKINYEQENLTTGGNIYLKKIKLLIKKINKLKKLLK